MLSSTRLSTSACTQRTAIHNIGSCCNYRQCVVYCGNTFSRHPFRSCINYVISPVKTTPSLNQLARNATTGRKIEVNDVSVRRRRKYICLFSDLDERCTSAWTACHRRMAHASTANGTYTERLDKHSESDNCFVQTLRVSSIYVSHCTRDVIQE